MRQAPRWSPHLETSKNGKMEKGFDTSIIKVLAKKEVTLKDFEFEKLEAAKY